MAKTKVQQARVEISVPLQRLFLIVLLLAWLTPLAYMLAWSHETFMNVNSWIFQATYFVLPFLFFIASYLFVRTQSNPFTAKLFVSGLLGFMGLTLYGTVSSLENILRMKFYPPVITDFNDDSLITAFGHEWTIMGICLALFSLTLFWIRKNQKD